MPTIQHLPNLKSPADSSQQSVMSEAQEAAAEKKPAAQKTESSPRRTDSAPLHVSTITMVGGSNDANNSSTFRGRVSRRGGHASQRTGPIDSSTTTHTSKRSTPPSLNDTRTKTKRTKQKASNNSPVTVDSKKSLPPAGWELIRNVTLPRKDSSDPTSSFGLGIRPDQGSDRVIVRSDYCPPTTSKTSAATLKPCEFPKKGDIVVAVNGQTVFDIGTMDVCSGFSMRPVAELMRNTEDGKPLQLDLLRPSTDDTSNSAAMSAVPERSQDACKPSSTKTLATADSSGRSLPQKDVEILKEDDADDADDVRRWKGAEEFLLATCADAEAAITGATSKYNGAISATATSNGKEKDAVAIMTAEHNKFVDAVNNALAQNRREVDLGLAKLQDEVSRYREATLNRNREASRYRTLVAGAGGQDGAVAQRVAVLDKAIEEKRQAKREYQRMIAAVGDKETMVQVIEERRRQLDAALVQSRAALGATAVTGKTNETPGAHSASSIVEKKS